MLVKWEPWGFTACASSTWSSDGFSLQQAGAIKTSVPGTSVPAGESRGPRPGLGLRVRRLTGPLPAGTVGGNVIVNTIAGVPAATFQSINKRLASPVAPGALTVSRPCPRRAQRMPGRGPGSHWLAFRRKRAWAQEVLA